MHQKPRVTIAMPLADQLLDRLHMLDSRLQVTSLTSVQRRVYRDGRPLWAGYGESATGAEQSEEEARKAVDDILASTEILFTNPITPKDILAKAPDLRWVQLTSAGVDRLLEAPLLRSDVTVTTASGIHAGPIGEYVLTVMLAFAKGLPAAMTAQSERTWRPFWADELYGKTVGIVGLGAIGGRVASLARAFGMRVLAIRRSVRERTAGRDDEPVDELLPGSDLSYLLGESDYVVIAVPLTAESRAMIGETEIATMKPTAVIVNIARGAVIDEPALMRALKDRRIGGAALDVFSQEPLPPDSELWGLDNVIATPHISGGFPRYMELAVDLFGDNLRRYLAGEPLRNVVDINRGY
jgi:phosphoglycerate dehydrogenase-like enzyme